jgi:phage FluMu gp28-like protein
MSVDELKYAVKLTLVRVKKMDGELDLLRYIIELRNGWERYSPDVIASVNAVIDGKYPDVYAMISEANWAAMEQKYLDKLYYPSPFRRYFEQKAKIVGDS